MKPLLITILIAIASISYAQMPNELTNTDKIYGLSKFWQEVNYNFVFLNKVDRAEWDKAYKTLIAEVQNTPNDYEYYRLLQKFCALLEDGHTNVGFPKSIKDSIYRTQFGDYQLFLSNIEDKAIITRINASKQKELPIGTELIKVNGLATNQYLSQNVIPYISSSTKYILKDWGTQRLLEAPVGTSFDLEFKLPNGDVKALKLKHEKSKEEEIIPPFEKRELLDFKWIDKEIAYVALNSFGYPKIDTLFVDILPELYRAKKLIIDLRYNGGGRTDVGREIFQYLTNDTIAYGSKSQSRLHIPTYKAWGKWTNEADTANNAWSKQSYLSYRDEYYHDFTYTPDTINHKNKRLVVPTVLLIGHNTASAAEDFLIYADNQEHMTKVGEPTFGSTGQPMIFDLVNGSKARVCTKKDTYPNGKEFVGYGIQPDIEIKKSLSDYLENKDPALDEAVKLLKNK